MFKFYVYELKLNAMPPTPPNVGTTQEKTMTQLTRETMKELQPHQQRVVDEKQELDAKREKLGAFKNTDLFAGLPW